MQTENIFSDSPILELGFALIYASDRKRSIEFYEKYFSFKVDPSVKMDGDQVYGHMGLVGIWIGGGHHKTNSSEKDVRATVMLQVRSTGDLLSRLKKDGVKVYQEKPVRMSPTSFWFQCADPDGNILDFLGKE